MAEDRNKPVEREAAQYWPAGRPARIWRHQSYVGAYFVTDSDGYIIASGLTPEEARRLLSAPPLRGEGI